MAQPERGSVARKAMKNPKRTLTSGRKRRSGTFPRKNAQEVPIETLGVLLPAGIDGVMCKSDQPCFRMASGIGGSYRNNREKQITARRRSAEDSDNFGVAQPARYRKDRMIHSTGLFLSGK